MLRPPLLKARRCVSIALRRQLRNIEASSRLWLQHWPAIWKRDLVSGELQSYCLHSGPFARCSIEPQASGDMAENTDKSHKPPNQTDLEISSISSAPRPQPLQTKWQPQVPGGAPGGGVVGVMQSWPIRLEEQGLEKPLSSHSEEGEIPF